MISVPSHIASLLPYQPGKSVAEIVRQVHRGHAAGAQLALEAVAVRKRGGQSGGDEAHRAASRSPTAASSATTLSRCANRAGSGSARTRR